MARHGEALEFVDRQCLLEQAAQLPVIGPDNVRKLGLVDGSGLHHAPDRQSEQRKRIRECPAKGMTDIGRQLPPFAGLRVGVSRDFDPEANAPDLVLLDADRQQAADEEAFVVPNLTFVVPVNAVPVAMTLVPPRLYPVGGLTFVTSGTEAPPPIIAALAWIRARVREMSDGYTATSSRTPVIGNPRSPLIPIAVAIHAGLSAGPTFIISSRRRNSWLLRSTASTT